MGVTVVVLAAGASTRFGSAKQLFVVGDETLIRRAARIARAVAPTIVVIPDRLGGFVAPATSQSMHDALAGLDVEIVENADAAEGLASSIRAGVRACSGDVLITLCDQIAVPSSHLVMLVATAAPLAATWYQEGPGVPAFFSECFRDELLALRGDRGAKVLFERHVDQLRSIPLPTAAIDIDEVSDTRPGGFF